MVCGRGFPPAQSAQPFPFLPTSYLPCLPRLFLERSWLCFSPRRAVSTSPPAGGGGGCCPSVQSVPPPPLREGRHEGPRRGRGATSTTSRRRAASVTRPSASGPGRHLSPLPPEPFGVNSALTGISHLKDTPNSDFFHKSNAKHRNDETLKPPKHCEGWGLVQ